MERDLNPDEKILLQISAKDCINILERNKKLIHAKQMAFGYYSKEAKEEYQIQITVTRSSNDFLEAFQTEEMSDYVLKPNSTYPSKGGAGMKK